VKKDPQALLEKQDKPAQPEQQVKKGQLEEREKLAKVVLWAQQDQLEALARLEQQVQLEL